MIVEGGGRITAQHSLKRSGNAAQRTGNAQKKIGEAFIDACNDQDAEQDSHGCCRQDLSDSGFHKLNAACPLTGCKG